MKPDRTPARQIRIPTSTVSSRDSLDVNGGKIMKPGSIFGALAIFCCAFAMPAHSQNPEIKFIADTLVVQADGTYQADPDLATLTFDVTAHDKELASSRCGLSMKAIERKRPSRICCKDRSP
jgi:hypothetical protein